MILQIENDYFDWIEVSLRDLSRIQILRRIKINLVQQVFLSLNGLWIRQLIFQTWTLSNLSSPMISAASTYTS